MISNGAHRWKETEKALEGLFSHWVTEDILAMARLSSTVLFHENTLAIDQFKRSAHTHYGIISAKLFVNDMHQKLSQGV
jgi:hypothetical protein